MTWFLWARMGMGSHREKEYDTDSERSERDIEKMALFTIASKRIKHLGINLPKEPKDQYSKIYKILMKEMDDDTNKWNNFLCSMNCKN